MNTKLILQSFFIVLTLLISNSLLAQLTFQVNTPANIQGSYGIVPAEFGADFPTLCNGIPAISGEMIIVDDGIDTIGTTTDACDPILNDLTGKIALIDRGICEFGTKCLAAENAGAIAVVVCNDDDTPSIPMIPGIDGGSVTIPAMMMDMVDCATIRTEIPVVEAAIIFQTDNDGDEVYWGNISGQGDFNGGLNDWTTTALSCNGQIPEIDLWFWSADATANMGGFVGGGGDVTSPSACNGAMGFDSDFYDNAGQGASNIGGGTCPARQLGELISPTIDLTGFQGNAISLKFYQGLRQFTSNYFVSYSNDDGETWVDIPINEEFPANSQEIDEWERVPLLGADFNSTTFKIKFTMDANYFYWLIDDVQLIQTEANNIRVTDFFSIAPNRRTPVTQISEFKFISDIYNAGSQPQTNVNLNMTVVNNSNGDVVYAEDLVYGTIDPDSLAENQVFGSFTPLPDLLTNYTGTYTLTSDSTDFDASDNTASFTFAITDSTFSKENGRTRGLLPGFNDGQTHSWAMGMYYLVPNGEGFFVSSLQIGIDNADELGGQSIDVLFYKFNNDGQDLAYAPEEMELIAFNSINVAANTSAETVYTIPLFSFPELNPIVELENEGEYLILVAYNQPDGEDTDMVLQASAALDYNATFWLTRPADTTFFGGGQTPPQFGPFVAVGEHSLEDNEIFNGSFSAGFGPDLIPVIRMNVNPIPVVGVSALDPANVTNIYPVPTNTVVNIDLDLVEPTKDLMIKVLDTQGKLMFQKRYQDVQQQTFTYDVSDFATGNYFVHIHTDKGARSKYFVVIK